MESHEKGHKDNSCKHRISNYCIEVEHDGFGLVTTAVMFVVRRCPTCDHRKALPYKPDRDELENIWHDLMLNDIDERVAEKYDIEGIW